MDISECNYPVADMVKKMMEEKGLKQCAVAEKAVFSKQQFSDMLNGRRIMRAFDIMNIIIALNVDANDLFGITEKRG